MERVRAPIPLDDDRDNVVVMRDVTWRFYEEILDARGEHSRPKIAFLDGELEIMTTSRRHEITKTMLARLLEAWVELNLCSLNGIGSATFNRKKDEAGLEPDECYCVGEMKEFPDLAIEVVQTHGGIDKLEIYRRLGVREVWFWINDRIHVHALTGTKYRLTTTSIVFPRLDLVELARIVSTCDDSFQTETVRTYRKAIERRQRRHARTGRHRRVLSGSRPLRLPTTVARQPRRTRKKK